MMNEVAEFLSNNQDMGEEFQEFAAYSVEGGR
jgi:hypothetical protein